MITISILIADNGINSGNGDQIKGIYNLGIIEYFNMLRNALKIYLFIKNLHFLRWKVEMKLTLLQNAQTPKQNISDS